MNYFLKLLCLFPQAIYISRITDGGAAFKDGKLKVGDRVFSVSLKRFYSIVFLDLYLKIKCFYFNN